MPELPLDHKQGDPFPRHLNRMRMPELVRREPAWNSGHGGGVVQLRADPG